MTIRELLFKIQSIIKNTFNDCTNWLGDGASKLIELRFLDFTIGQAIFTIIIFGFCISFLFRDNEERPDWIINIEDYIGSFGEKIAPFLYYIYKIVISIIYFIIVISIAYGMHTGWFSETFKEEKNNIEVISLEDINKLIEENKDTINEVEEKEKKL